MATPHAVRTAPRTKFHIPRRGAMLGTVLCGLRIPHTPVGFQTQWVPVPEVPADDRCKRCYTKA